MKNYKSGYNFYMALCAAPTKEKRLELIKNCENINVQGDRGETALIWAKYSQYPFKRQMRSLWYYVQCDRLSLRIEPKYLLKIRKFKDDPTQCLEHARKNKYCFVPGTILTRYFKGIKHEVLVNDDDSFSYNGDKYETLSAVATKIAGMRVSGTFFFGLNKGCKHDN